MKKLFYLSLILMLISCNNRQKSVEKNIHLPGRATSKPANNTPPKKVQYSDQQLEQFLDSIGHLPTQALADKAAFWADSIFKNQAKIDIVISASDFKKLKKAVHTKVIDVLTARRIFGNKAIDSACNEASVLLTLKAGLIPVVYYPFDKHKSDFNEYAICIGDPTHCANAYLYFFKGNKIISKHNGYSRYGLDLEHYKDSDGKTVVYYKEEFDDGSGIWWNNYFFYKYDGDKLIPVLNELQNGNLQSSELRAFWLESFVQKTNPLTIKMVYYDQFSIPTDSGDFGPNIINDSTIVRYNWNEQLKIYQGDYKNSKINKPQVLSYYLASDDLLFINAYYKTLKATLFDKVKKKRTLYYLNQVKNYQRKQ
ncbi:hypothetical protein G7092_10975 [Mucilaginibacter sp. HC2]|uniref:hypothetical protein n=1 Tax=Mucilaginibacter inviolabilis TaxID=2714892 RepID=UPI00140DDCA4|nr:hypothetical protein [Mucilaginibacter inviolabilis]NHA04323.1 hypothetical protein [Mucilaginibacter inviolabilis]